MGNETIYWNIGMALSILLLLDKKLDYVSPRRRL